jgi:hypothetical protein
MTQKSTLSKEKREDSGFEVLSRDLITRILGTVVYDKAFFFYTDIAQPTGDYAVSLQDLCSRMNTTVPKSLTFHLKRGDFENWIREAIGDSELADRIKKLKKLKTTWKSEITTRRKLCAVVEDRVAELQELWRHALTWSERVLA